MVGKTRLPLPLVVRIEVFGGSLTRRPKGHFADSWLMYLDK